MFFKCSFFISINEKCHLKSSRKYFSFSIDQWRKLTGNKIYYDCVKQKFVRHSSLSYHAASCVLFTECFLWQYKGSFCCSLNRTQALSLCFFSQMHSCLKTMVYANSALITVTTLFTDIEQSDVYKRSRWSFSKRSYVFLTVEKKCADIYSPYFPFTVTKIFFSCS